jgi:beta-lactamase superfamily II metal-dependent hydrolase
MRLTIFESDQGDCLLLRGKSGHLVLCDGGMRRSMTDVVRQELSNLDRAIDLVYVSHVDNDHISGVLQMLEDEALWRAFDHLTASGETVRAPQFPRPPKIKGILHNAFRDMVSQNNKSLANVLVNTAPALYATGVPELAMAADDMMNIALGIPEAIKVARLCKDDALDIPINKPPGVQKGSRLLYAGRPGDQFRLGSMAFTLIGPTDEELKKLRTGWNNWLRDNPNEVKKIRAKLKQQIDAFSNSDLTGSPFDLRDWNGVPDHEGVSAPNVASLMFLVEEDGKTVLLTGDGQQDFILQGLRRTEHLADAGVHVDVLKVQHHGSEHNLDDDFARQVSADHYVFCGNGSHGNPEESVIQRIYDSRLGKASQRALAPQAEGRDFHFWFSTTSAASDPLLERTRTFKAREALVSRLENKAQGRLKVHYNQGASVALDI